MKKLFCLSAALLLSVCATPLSAQALQSLDELVKAAGCTPVVDGGKTGSDSPAQTHSSYGAAKAFNGVTYSTSDSERWLGSIQNGVYLRYAMPDDYTSPFLLRGYRLHALSCGWDNTDRAPRSWELYGHLDANAAADDEGWQLIDTQTDVVWPFTSGDYDASVQGSQFVLEFSVSTMLNFRAFKWVPTKSARPSSEDTWTVGLMELVFLGNESFASTSLQVQGSQGDLGNTTPAYGTVEGLESGTTVELSAEEFAYTDTTRYTCIGYCTEVLQPDGTWLMEGTNLVRTATYESDGQSRRLTWLWEEDGYTLTAGLEYGGLERVSVSPGAGADGYYAAGTEVTLTPVCATDPVSTFKNWYGDVPEGQERANPLTVTMDSPKTIYADFSRRWKFVEGTGNQITDGNFVLRLSSVRSDGTYGLGVDGNTPCYISGTGFLDLSGVRSDLNITLSQVSSFAFSGCMDLVSLVLPDSVTTIGSQSFYLCRNLRSVQLPAYLELLNYRAFYECTNLVSVTPFLPDTLKTLGEDVFFYCRNLTGDVVLRHPDITSIPTQTFTSTRITSADFSGTSATAIGRYVFQNCTALTNVVLPSTLETINYRAFYSATNLKTVTPFLPTSVKAIGEDAFAHCRNLAGDLVLSNPALTQLYLGTFNQTLISSVDMGNTSVTNIRYYVFLSCSALTNAVLSPTLESVGNRSFFDCKNLETVTPFLPKSVVTIEPEAFSGTAITNALELTNREFRAIASSAFSSVKLPRVTLPNATFTIGNYAFAGIPTNTPVYFLGKAPTSIGTEAFNTRNSAWPCVFYACRRLDEKGWADCTKELTDSDLAKASYPGRGTFGVLVNNGLRHWLVHWNSPEASGPALLLLR